MLWILPSRTTAKSVPLIGLSAPSGPEAPGEADMFAETVGLAEQGKTEIRKALLHAFDQRVDAVMAIARHQRVDIFCVLGPMLTEDLAPAAWRPFVPQIDIAAGNRVDVGHCSLLRFGRMDRLTDYRRFTWPNRLPRRSRISIWGTCMACNFIPRPSPRPFRHCGPKTGSRPKTCLPASGSRACRRRRILRLRRRHKAQA